MLIYKYTPHNNEKYKYDIIKKCELWFSTTKHFNDPIDFNLAYRQEYSEKEIRQYFENFVKKPNCHKTLKELLRDYGKNKDFVAKQNKMFRGFKEMIGILCMSKNPTSILMWSHYANAHKGIVYEFDYDLLAFKKTEGYDIYPIMVEYTHSRKYELLSYTLQYDDMKQQFIRLLKTKAVDWAYEEEIRFMNLGKGNFCRKFDPKCLKSIIFGMRTNGEEIKKVKKLCKEHNLGHIKFKQAKFIDGRFEIEIVNLKDGKTR